MRRNRSVFACHDHVGFRHLLIAIPAFALAPALAFAAPCTLPVQFGPPQSLVTGWNPSHLLSGDFNEDGLTDLATATSRVVAAGGAGSAVTISLGKGDGTFQAPVDYPAGNAPFGLATGDFNGDGITDIAAANVQGGNVSILLGQGLGGVGDGTFGPPTNFAAGARPFTIAVEDFDEDGISDLAVSNNGAPAGVSVLRGLGSGGVGDGTFALPVFYPVANLPAEVRSADFDEDGIVDLVVAVAYAGHIALFRGNGVGGVGDGTFGSPATTPAGPEPFGMAIADWDADGILDLAVANGSSGGLRFLRGLGVGGVGNATFAPPVMVAPVNCAAAVGADIDGDGHLDLLTAETNSGYPTPVLVAYGNGDGTFGTPKPYMAGVIPADIVVGDFDASPRLDIAVANYFDNFLTVRLGVCMSDPNTPTITRVRDVPNDQGGSVFVTWTRSALDAPGGDVNAYRVWRRIPPELAASATRIGGLEVRQIAAPVAGSSATSLTYWEALATLPAQRLDGYGYTAATTQDSLPGGNPFTAFFVSALTPEIDVFYDSPVDSGYSVDNLAPAAPQNVVATVEMGSIRVAWRPNGEPDLAGYMVHKGNTVDFVPSLATLLASLPDTQYVDPSPSPALWYKVIAFDVHANPSAAATASLSGPTAVLISTVAPVARANGVDLAWSLSSPTPVQVQRREDAGDWILLGSVVPNGRGIVSWFDGGVRAGFAYTYRLRFLDETGEAYGGEVHVVVPALAFGLFGVQPNPVTGGAAVVRFALDSASDARLEVVDVAGRRVLTSDVGTLGPGLHAFDLDRLQPLRNGVYLVQLTSAGRTLSTRAVVIR